MNYYHIWCNLKDSRKDLEFVEALRRYLGWLQESKLIENYRITRKKLGLGPPDLGDFHIILESRDLAQLERAFEVVSARSGEVEKRHEAVYSAVRDFRAALYRDFPDEARLAAER